MTTFNNNLVVAGGIDHRGHPTNQIFTLEHNLLKEYTRMKLSRGSATAVGHEGMLLIIGGRVDQEIFSSTELFDSKIEHWYDCENLPKPHYSLQSLVVKNTVYLLGGFDEDYGYSYSVFYAHLGTLSSHKLEWNTEISTPWARSAPATMFGEQLLVFGGVKPTLLKGNVCTSNIYILDEHCWVLVDHIPAAIHSPSAVSIRGNKIIVLGGVADKNYGGKYLETVWSGLFKY